jgi:hypothetical protein
MYFLIASICALIGIVVLLSRVKPERNYYQPIINTDRWIESWELSLQKFLRQILRFIVVHLVGWYRFIIHDITIHKTMKRKVRELLYEHHREQRSKTTLKIPLEKFEEQE